MNATFKQLFDSDDNNNNNNNREQQVPVSPQHTFLKWNKNVTC